MTLKLRVCSAVVAGVLVAPAMAGAQLPAGALAGIVCDSSGARVAGARVTIVNHDTSLSRTTISSDLGEFAASALPPGEYVVAIERAGFRRVERSVVVETGSTSRVEAVLEPGDVTEAVSVT